MLNVNGKMMTAEQMIDKAQRVKNTDWYRRVNHVTDSCIVNLQRWFFENTGNVIHEHIALRILSK